MYLETHNFSMDTVNDIYSKNMNKIAFAYFLTVVIIQLCVILTTYLPGKYQALWQGRRYEFWAP